MQRRCYFVIQDPEKLQAILNILDSGHPNAISLEQYTFKLAMIEMYTTIMWDLVKKGLSFYA